MKQLLKYSLLSIAIFMTPFVFAANVLLMVNPGCHYCGEAERILNSSGVKFQTRMSSQGAVPRLYVNGEYIGTGVDAVQSWVDANRGRR